MDDAFGCVAVLILAALCTVMGYFIYCIVPFESILPKQLPFWYIFTVKVSASQVIGVLSTMALLSLVAGVLNRNSNKGK